MKTTSSAAITATLKHVFVYQNDKGGSGKTTAAEWTAAALQLGGRSFVVIDADGGNNSYIRRCGKGSALVVRWQFDGASADDFIADNLADTEIAIIDLGANTLASDAPVLSFFSVLFLRLHGRGVKIWRVGIASPNAPGTKAIMRDLILEAGTLMTPIVVLNNSDDSEAFEDDLSETKAMVVRMPHLSPGVIAIRLRRSETLAVILEQPAPRCFMAMGLMARAVHAFVSQAPFSEVIGEVGLARLEVLAARAPGPLNYTVSKPRDASDGALAANFAVGAALRALQICDEATAWAALCEWRCTFAAYRAIVSP